MVNVSDRGSVEISSTYDIARKLKGIGYLIADSMGKQVAEPEHKVIGILDPRESKERSLLGKLLGGHERALYLGTIWVDNEPRGANEKNWVFEVYGLENLSRMKDLVRDISPRDVQVEVELKSELLRYQRFLSDVEEIG